MPPLPRKSTPSIVNSSDPAALSALEPEQVLGPYRFHGVSTTIRHHSDKESIGECPWCAKQDKFSINLKDGRWRCWSCMTGTSKGGGNLLTFIRLLWQHSDKATEDYTALASQRRLLYPETLSYWGVCRSILTGDWLVPAYDEHGKICQLYRYTKEVKTGKMKLLATPSLRHGLFGRQLLDSRKPGIFVCEGPWDAMALWEIARLVKSTKDGHLEPTGNDAASLLGQNNVLAVPGANVFFSHWSGLFSHKEVSLLFDSDHPHQHPQSKVEIGLQGYRGMKYANAVLLAANPRPKRVYYLSWGDKGYDPRLPSGYDVRDHLAAGGTDEDSRRVQLEGIMKRLSPVPLEWSKAGSAVRTSNSQLSSAMECHEWSLCETAWKKSLDWRRDLGDVLSVMLAVSMSTNQAGDQLFLQVIGDPGSAKSRLCDAMLLSKKCFALEHLTGFHSGWKDGSGEDFSLLARINHKTLITPEGNVLMTSPHLHEIMSQQRRIFDGSSGASYKNRKEDMRYTGLRTPWIIAGTPALLDIEQSRVGDRFLRIHIPHPDSSVKHGILRRVGYSAIRATVQSANGELESHLDEQMLHAYQLTAGYVDHLQDNASELLEGVLVKLDQDYLVEECAKLAQLTAYMRARPGWDKTIREKDTKEIVEVPSRLQHQFVRLAMCLAAVLNRKTVDTEVMRRVRKVALDTSQGRTLDIAQYMFDAGSVGLEIRELAKLTNITEDRLRKWLRFLRGIRVATYVQRSEKNRSGSKPYWKLTTEVYQLYREVVEEHTNPVATPNGPS